MCRKATTLPEFSKTAANISKLKSYIQYLGSYAVRKEAPAIKAATFFPEIAHHLPGVTEIVKAEMRAVCDRDGYTHTGTWLIFAFIIYVEGTPTPRGQSHAQLVQQPCSSK